MAPELRFQLTADDFLEAAQEARRRKGVWAYLPIRVVVIQAAACAVLGALFVILFTTLPDAGQPLILAYGFFAIIPLQLFANWVWAWTAPTRTIKKWLRTQDTRDALGPLSVTISSERIKVEYRSGQVELAWHTVTRIEPLDHYIVIGLSQGGEVLIPHRAFVSPAQVDEFLASVRSYRAASPPAEMRCPKCRYDLRGTSIDQCPECGWRRDNASA